MTSPRILLVAGSVAATLAGIVPVIDHGPAAAAAQSAPAAITVSARDDGRSFVVPGTASVLSGVVVGDRASARRVGLTVVRASDGATLFTGTLATFHSLPVVAGTKLLVQVHRPAGFGSRRAAAALSWS